MQTKKINSISWYGILNQNIENCFLPLRDQYDHARLTTVKIDTYQLAHIDRNRYSVPTKYVGEKVDVKIYPFKIVIASKGDIIAEHIRLFSKDKDSLNPYHFLDLLMKKTRAYDDALVIKQWQLPNEFNNYHKMLQSMTKSTSSYGIDKIGNILKELDKDNRYSYEEVLSTLRFKEDKVKDKSIPKEVLNEMGIVDIQSSTPRINQYNSLLQGGEDIERRVI